MADVNITGPDEQSQEYYDTPFLDTIDTEQKNMWIVTDQIEAMYVSS